MRTLQKSPLATVERVAYAFAIRKAMRLGGAFRVEPSRYVVLVLRLPQDANLREYELASLLLAGVLPKSRRFAVLKPTVDRKGQASVDDILEDFRQARSSLALWPFDVRIPELVTLAADHVLDVEPLRPHHLVAAIKRVHGELVDIDAAARLLDYAPPTVFAALRPGRPLTLAIDRLAASQPSTEASPQAKVLRLEDLSGYGEARDWGLALAADLALWREGRLPWADVDGGLLLSGPPGTGKTMFAGALARSCGAHMVATSVSQWQSMGHLGDMLGAMRKSFQEAAANRPCVLFLDELDSIGDRQSFSGQSANYCIQVVNGLLELVDGADRREGVVIVGATNHPEKIDPALLRAGRLDRHIRIPLPGFRTRQELGRMYLGPSLSDEDLNAIAVATEGFTGADFEKLSREVRRENRRTGVGVTAELVLSRLPVPLAIEGELRWNVAVHEAGHAVVGLHLGVGVLHCVAVRKEVRGSGKQQSGAAYFETKEVPMRDRRSYLDQIAMLMGGLAAEAVVLGTTLEGAGGADGSDIHQAADLATVMEVQLGMGEGLGYLRGKTPEELDSLRKESPVVARRVEKVLLRELARAKEIVAGHRASLEAIARALTDKGFVDGKEVEHMLASPGGRGRRRA
ncbi:AAA family ATPase [Sinorhizobium meliloti]|uniref:AAA family ATPase n=1 Tax=Rhizobium meliloti TaxID=382 RepID=UPI000FD6E237|nr:AAA family ATPase [Sinorhizobium meliloti]RVK33833.1 AAA family ATPase [Sinorhizobium meliloti]